jgi:hypothetical protein
MHGARFGEGTRSARTAETSGSGRESHTQQPKQQSRSCVAQSKGRPVSQDPATFATDTRFGQLAHLDARHRAHARVEDRIRTAKDTGLGHFPSRSFAINTAWLTVVMLAVDLIAATQHLLLHGDLAKAEPKTLRYRLLHVAARLTRGQRRLWLRIQRSWPWATTSRPRSPGSPPCPSPPVDLRSRHDERRELPADRHAGDIVTPITGSDTTEINNPDQKISSQRHE